ncbi:S1C family serine protease [Halochromatium sp.]
MRATSHSITLTLVGFIAGATVVYALDHLPSIKAAPDAGRPASGRQASGHQTGDASSAGSSNGASSAAIPGINLDAAPGFADAVAMAAPAVVSLYAASSQIGSHIGPQAGSHTSIRKQSAHLSGESRSELLTSTRAGRPLNQPATRLGAGVVIASQGLIVTNGHLVRDRDQIRIELVDGRILPAELLGIDDATDLAVLRSPLAEVAPIALGDPSSLRVGDVVLAIGNPYGIGQTVSLGIVSATGRKQLGLTEVEDFIQTDAAINPGNSGGALVDTAGRLVGIATAGLSESGHSEGVGFAISSTLVMQVVEAIVEESTDDRLANQGWLGIGGRSVTQELEQRFGLRISSGVLVSSLIEDGPAAAAGLRAGDVITAFAGQQVGDASQLWELIRTTALEHEVPLVLWRGSKRIDLTVRAPELEAQLHTEVTDSEPHWNGDRTAGDRHQARLEIKDAIHHQRPCEPRSSDC